MFQVSCLLRRQTREQPNSAHRAFGKHTIAETFDHNNVWVDFSVDFTKRIGLAVMLVSLNTNHFWKSKLPLGTVRLRHLVGRVQVVIVERRFSVVLVIEFPS